MNHSLNSVREQCGRSLKANALYNSASSQYRSHSQSRRDGNYATLVDLVKMAFIFRAVRGAGGWMNALKMVVR